MDGFGRKSVPQSLDFNERRDDGSNELYCAHERRVGTIVLSVIEEKWLFFFVKLSLHEPGVEDGLASSTECCTFSAALCIRRVIMAGF